MMKNIEERQKILIDGLLALGISKEDTLAGMIFTIANLEKRYEIIRVKV